MFSGCKLALYNNDIVLTRSVVISVGINNMRYFLVMFVSFRSLLYSLKTSILIGCSTTVGLYHIIMSELVNNHSKLLSERNSW